MAPTLKFASGLLAAASVVAGSWLPDIVARDVAIIGGGASGAYAAVRLKEDYGKSIVLVEKAGRLVGSTPPSTTARSRANSPRAATSRPTTTPRRARRLILA